MNQQQQSLQPSSPASPPPPTVAVLSGSPHPIPTTSQPNYIISPTLTTTASSSIQQHAHPASTSQVTTTASSSQPPLTTTYTTSTEQQHGHTLATSSPQPPTNSSSMSQHSNPGTMTVQQREHSLAGQITAMTISPHLSPTSSSSHTPTTSQSSYTASHGTMTVQQQLHGYPPPPLTGQSMMTMISTSQPPSRINQHEYSHNVSPSVTHSSVGQQHGPATSGQSTVTMTSSSQPPSRSINQYEHSRNVSPSVSSLVQQHPPTSDQFTATSSSQPPPASTQRITPQHGYAASPDASIVQQHGRHPHPPTTGHVAPSLPPQTQSIQYHSNLTHFGTSQHAYSNPSTAMTFRQHGHPAPPPPAAPAGSQIMTTIPSHVPRSSFQHSTTAYPSSRANTGQHHVGYSSSYPYNIPPQHASPLYPSSTGYASQCPNFSMETVQGSLPSSTPPSSYQPSMGSSPYPSHYGPAAVYYGQRHILSQALSGTHRPPQSGKVFILYCKDQQLPQTFSDDVLDLADTLNHCGGFTCTIDHYVDVPPPNWNVWTQQKIEESQYVLLVCSPTLAQVLKMPHDYTLEMEKGKYYASTVVNYVKPQKFIPVFLNYYIPRVDPLEWVPTQLHMSTLYGLNISELSSVLTVSEGTPRHILDEKLRRALSDDRFRNIAKLVNHLRGETATSPPVPPQLPISVPPTAGPSFPNYPSTLTAMHRQSLHEHIPSSSFEKIAGRMPRDWFTLGVKLGVESTQLQKLRTKHSFNHVPAALEMFSLWQQTKGRLATRKALKDVLVKMEYGRLAYELFPDVKN